MTNPPDDGEVTVIHEETVDDAFAGVPRVNESATKSDVEDLDVLTGDEATTYRETALDHDQFGPVQRYCEETYDQTIDTDSPTVLEHPYVSASHSVLFYARPTDDASSLTITVYFNDDSVSKVIGTHERELEDGQTEVRVVHPSNDGFIERVARIDLT